MPLFFILIVGFLILRLVITVVNALLNPKLPTTDHVYQDKISILIPARNEAACIGTTIQHLINQDYNNYELLILDDGSTDETAQIVLGFAKEHAHIHLLKGEELPAGWLGKNWACHQLAQAATGKYLLFIDADVLVYNQLINAALMQMKKHRLSLLSIFPDQKLHTIGEQIVVPIMHYLLLTMLPLHFVRRFKQASLAAANGQFMLFESAVYRQYELHKQVKAEVTEDIELVKYMKRKCLKAGTYLGNALVKCRMYTNGKEAIEGFSKNLLAGFGNAVGLLLFIALVAIGYIPLIWLEPSLMLKLLPLILITNALVAWLSNQSVAKTIALHPLKIALLCYIACLSIYRNLTKTNHWKGRNISIK